jgi:hypothetical protein
VAILAASPEDQERWLLDDRVPAPVDELAPQFDDAVPGWFPRLKQHDLLSPAAEQALNSLAQAFESMRKPGDHSLWEVRALYERLEWEHIRRLASTALLELREEPH